jgi:hypothetical protein
MTLEVVNGEMDRGLAGEVGTFIRAQAAEIARLKAKVEAGDMLDTVLWDLATGSDLSREDYLAAMAAIRAYAEAGK